MNRHSADLVGSPVEPTRLVARDLASEVIAAIVAKPGRSFLTALGTVLGVGTLIVILGLTSTASGQVSARFDAQAATTVTVKDARDPEGDAPFPFTAEAIARARALNGVTGAGVIYAPTTDDQVASAHPGAALQVADEATITVAYLAPRDVSVAPPPDPRALRDHISGDLGSLFYALAGICLLIGTVGIANTTLVAVMERSAEIGLRRALGATGRHIAAHVVAESASLGILGGVLGTALGLTAVIAIALLRGWSPIIEPALLLWAPLLGLATGAAAGLYPARKATRIEPTEALRSQ
ncbi:MAG TPA: ABC transporter permease [Arachnia sp.]|nr:ABC transporter permease [Arachnia sp.]